MDRRTFLKIASLGSVAFAGGCTPGEDKHLFSLVQAPDDMVTGQPTWYAATCRECPAGCGILAKNREGRVVKIEGNPLHPINAGALCMRGQAAIQALYHPDRLRHPLRRENGAWLPMTFAEAETQLFRRLRLAADRGSGRVALISETPGEQLLQLIQESLGHWRGAPPLIYEPLAYETLKSASAMVYGVEGLPVFRMERADLLLSFGADFLETWLSPIEYARRFAAMRALSGGEKGLFFAVAPFQGLTAANADLWLACRPGGEAAVALCLIRSALEAGRGSELPADLRDGLRVAAEPFTPEMVSQRAGLAPDALARLSAHLLSARRPLVLGGGALAHSPAALTVEVAAAALNRVLDPMLTRVDLGERHRVEIAARRSEVLVALERMAGGGSDLLLLHNTNPAYSLLPSDLFAGMLKERRPFVVAFSAFLDETAALADLVVPLRQPLESWDTYGGHTGLLSLLQPASGRLSEAPQLGDLLLAAQGERAPAPDYHRYLIQRLVSQGAVADTRGWLKLLQSGGGFPPPAVPEGARPGAADTSGITRALNGAGSVPLAEGLVLLAAPSLRFTDGRGANRPWLCEAPDPLTQVCWQTPLQAHPETLVRNGLRQEQVVRLKAGGRSIEAALYASHNVWPGVLVMSLGQGRKAGGRWAEGVGVDPGRLFSGELAPLCGAPLYGSVVQMEAAGREEKLAHTDGSRLQHDRPIALSIRPSESGPAHGAKAHGLTMDTFPLTLPLSEGYDPQRDFYPPHEHDGYRWAMIVDLDRCIGCGACAVACAAENNIPVVGVERILEGREMAWLRIERYLDPAHPEQITFLPMMCQHCDNAPCEAVCPVYAPHHSKEGLNNQIYNRCIGTRFCAQNCPYKVRRFNWFSYQWPEPMPLLLNPDVTVRAKGVMEKCSFCVQRIKAAHNLAKNEKRSIRDGEVVPACVQTCPTAALHFGSLMDMGSRVRALSGDPRAYQVMGYLNTKPAVIYLKKVRPEI